LTREQAREFATRIRLGEEVWFGYTITGDWCAFLAETALVMYCPATVTWRRACDDAQRDARTAPYIPHGGPTPAILNLLDELANAP
jgi:hypothetical protein